ncbi:hypothetical protein B5807_03641, partial [Epicoccum nigrum]
SRAQPHHHGRRRKLATSFARELGVALLCLAVLPSYHSCAMAHRLVPSRQDVNRVAMECTRQDWMGSYGVYRTDNLAVHLLYTAEGTGHCRAAMG